MLEIHLILFYATISFVCGNDYLVNSLPVKESGLPNDKPHLRRCTYSKAHGMYGADCSVRDLNELPRNLRSNIEILDASYNRIRTLDTLSLYPKIRYLYLSENFISDIEPGTIDKLDNLEVLDLSVNGIHFVPGFVFEIDTLRRLYLANNSFRHNFLEDVQRPIKAPLEYINVAYSHIHKMPSFGIMPDLQHLNLSGNPLNRVTVDDMTPLCRLRLLDITNIGPNNINDCECLKLQAYLSNQNITVIPDIRSICNYSQFGIIGKCPESYLNDTDLTLQNECFSRVQIREQEQQTKTTWIAVVISITTFLLVFIAILYVIHVRNVRNMKLEEMNHKQTSEISRALVKE